MHRKPKAKLYLRFRTPEGKQSPYCPALFDHKSRIRPFWCLVSFREDEVSVVEATDVNHDTKCIRVAEKPYLDSSRKTARNAMFRSRTL